MNKFKKEIKRKKWAEKKTDNHKKKIQLLNEIAVLEKHMEALHETT